MRIARTGAGDTLCHLPQRFHTCNISPDFSINVPGQKGRHTREPYPDWDSDLIYVTDGNGGGLTVLRYTGPLPTKPPTPGVR